MSDITRSQNDFDQARKLLPGGINSPVRAFKSVGGSPRFFDHASGAYVWDVDNNQSSTSISILRYYLRSLK